MSHPRSPLPSAFAIALPFGFAALALVACHESRPPFDPLEPVAVETAVNPGLVGVGEHAAVFCTRLNGRGEPLPGGTFAIGVAPTELVYVEGMELFSHRSGTHQVSCNDPELGLVDTTPAPLEVTPGPAVKTFIAIDPASVAAGTPAAVTCQAQDEHGNPAAANLRLEVTPPAPAEGDAPAAPVTIDGIVAVTATTAGAYEVLCYAATVDEAARAKATLTVVPGPRVGMALVYEPEQPAYRMMQQVTVKGQGSDAYGNLLAESFAIQITGAAPDGHHRVVGDAMEKIRFDLEGLYTITATALDEPGLSASAPIAIDETKPFLIVTAPDRGTVTDARETVTLTGEVADNLGRIGELRVGDLPIPIAPEGGPFSIEVPLRYGINFLDVHAVDPYGHETVVTRAVEKSTEYHAMTERTFETDGVDNALVLVILQEVFDDGDHEEATRDDLAHLFEFVVENLDIAALLPSPLTQFDCINGQCTLEFDSVTMDDVKVTMTLTNGRIHLRAELVKLAGNVTLYFPCDVPVICAVRPVQPLPGSVTTDRVVVETDIFLAIIDGQTVARTESTTVEMDGLDVQIADPTGIGQAAIDLVIVYLNEPLIAAVEDLVVGLIQNELADALNGLFSALTIDTTFEVPSPVPGQPANAIVIQTLPKGVDISPERLQVRVDGLSYALNPQRPHEHLGSIGHRGCAPPTSLQFPPPAPVVVGLHDDFINELLFAIWEGGTVSLALGPEEAAGLVGDFGLQDAHITVDALLPPVYNSCGADDDKVLERAQIGDLWVEAEALLAGEPVHLGLWLLTEAPVGVAFEPNEEGALQLALVLGDLEPMYIEVVINEGRFAGNDGAIVTLVQTQLVPRLLSTVTDAALFTLPSIDLGSLTSAVPAGTVINIDVREVARDNAYLTVQGALK